MKHLRRIVEVAVAVVVADYAFALQSPVVKHYLDHHPQDAGYLAVAAGLIVAAYKAARDRYTADTSTSAAPPSSGSPTMAAK